MIKKTFTAVAMMIALNSVLAQSRDVYTIRSIPYYDSLGNQTIYQKEYDHVTTKQDSIDFGYRIDVWSVSKPRHRRGAFYRVIVADLRRTKRGHVIIKPCANFNTPWFKYPFSDVKIGDTVYITRSEAMEPKF